MENEVGLLPCPFCGAGAAWGEGEQKTKYGNEQVYCTSCCAVTAPEMTKAEAAEWWNARTATTPSPLTPEEAKEQARQIVEAMYGEGCDWHGPTLAATCFDLHKASHIDRIASELMAALPLSPFPDPIPTTTARTNGQLPSSSAEIARRIAKKIVACIERKAGDVVSQGFRDDAAGIIESELAVTPAFLEHGSPLLDQVTFDNVMSRFTKGEAVDSLTASLVIAEVRNIIRAAIQTVRVGKTYTRPSFSIEADEASAPETDWRDIEKRGREMFAAELLNQLDRITSTTAAFHLVKSLCLIEVGRDPNTLGVEIEEATNNNG